MTILEKISSLMELKGWSAYRLAEEAGLPQSTISHMFTRNNLPSIPTLESICKAFGITLSQFFAEDGEPVVLTAEQKILLLEYGSLSKTQRDIIKNTMAEFKE